MTQRDKIVSGGQSEVLKESSLLHAGSKQSVISNRQSRIPTIEDNQLSPALNHSVSSIERSQMQQEYTSKLATPVNRVQKKTKESPYKSLMSVSYRSAIPKEEMAIIDDLNNKLLTLRNENTKLEAQQEYVCDNEVQSLQEASIRALQQKVEEEKQKLVLLTKQLNRQAEGMMGMSMVSGVDVAAELGAQLKETKEKVKIADDEYLSLQQYLKVVSEAEKSLVKYIPQFYHLLVRYDPASADFQATVEKLRAHLDGIRRNQINAQIESAKAAEQGDSYAARRRALEEEIAEARQLIDQESSYRREMTRAKENQKQELEQQLIEITFNYQLLVKQFREVVERREESFSLGDEESGQPVAENSEPAPQ